LSAAYPTQAQKQGLTPISCHAVLERSACAPFIKERRMKCINATSLRRKSGQWGTQRSLPVQETHVCPTVVVLSGALAKRFSGKLRHFGERIGGVRAGVDVRAFGHQRNSGAGR